MKKVSSVMLLVILICSFCIAAPIGSPTASLEAGKASIGGELSRQTQDVQVYGTGLLDGIAADVQTDMASLLLSYGMTDRFNVYGRLGYIDVEGNQKERLTGVGARATLAENLLTEGLDIGITGQFNLARLQTQIPVKICPCFSIPVDADIDLFETILAIGPSYEYGDFTVYGGPAIYRLDGDIEASAKLPPWMKVEDGSIKETTSIIGWIGGSWNAWKDLQLTGELQFGSDFSNIGLGCIWKF